MYTLYISTIYSIIFLNYIISNRVEYDIYSIFIEVNLL